MVSSYYCFRSGLIVSNDLLGFWILNILDNESVFIVKVVKHRLQHAFLPQLNLGHVLWSMLWVTIMVSIAMCFLLDAQSMANVMMIYVRQGSTENNYTWFRRFCLWWHISICHLLWSFQRVFTGNSWWKQCMDKMSRRKNPENMLPINFLSPVWFPMCTWISNLSSIVNWQR